MMNNTLREAVFIAAVLGRPGSEDPDMEKVSVPVEDKSPGSIIINCGSFSVRVPDGAVVYGERYGFGGGQFNL